mmetsp:Transcript_10572/g.10133  ORF Transcript_10572/g.10133 Transcript_10572/m.10133 type:complete len:115 (-) Transcript_10572:196-540(-)
MDLYRNFYQSYDEKLKDIKTCKNSDLLNADLILRGQFCSYNQRHLCQCRNDKNRHIDLLASCYLLHTKTGYRKHAEAVASGISVICINRHDWPEHPYQVEWLSSHSEVQFVDFD